MAQEKPRTTGEKVDLKKLREARKYQIAAATERMKRQRQAVQAIEAALSQGGLTVPELARITKQPASQVLYYLATLKKYGKVVEGEAEGSYFKYRLAEEKADAGKETAPIES
jgi:Fic family protein|uniref:Transcriptional regulator n=1 Tax=Desulfobacca acetoxidans TaxID=60893 RepID=A0A7C3UWY5_9BACT